MIPVPFTCIVHTLRGHYVRINYRTFYRGSAATVSRYLSMWWAITVP